MAGRNPAKNNRARSSRDSTPVTSKPKAPRRIFRRMAYWSFVLGLWTMIILSGAAAYVILTLPQNANLTLPARGQSLTILANDGSVLVRSGAFAGDDVLLEELPAYAAQAVIAIEDVRFYSHFGIDPVGLIRAIAANVKAGRVVQGGSTLTQQLAKNLFLKPERTFSRKFQEALLAVWLEIKFTKAEILQLYLNRVYYGAGAYGIEAAAQRYYRKPAHRLTLAEAAVLAGVLKAPTHYAPNRHRAKAEARAYRVLNKMVQAGFITRTQGQRAVDHPAIAMSRQAFPNSRYVVDWVRELLPGFVGKYKGDLIVETTIDPKLQRLAERSVAKNLKAYGKRRRVDQAAMIAFDRRGAVRALVGGRSYAKSQFNRAIKAKRQPGSAFKPFVYLAAVERGLRPRTIRIDEPVSIKGWRPRNYSKRYVGPITLKTALARSINTVAVKLVLEVGGRRVVKTARRLGISSPLHANPSIALGTAEVTLLELTAAYVPFSNGGYGIVPHVITRVKTRDKKTIYTRSSSGLGRVIKALHVSYMNEMLQATITSGTGRAAQLQGWPSAGKTGTSQDFRDAWFVGYTTELTTGVWVGNDNGKSTKKVTGSGLPAFIWRDFMAPAHNASPARALPSSPKPPEHLNPLDRLVRLFGFY